MPRISLPHVLLNRRMIRALLAISAAVLILGVLNSTALGIPARQVGGCGPSNNVGGRAYHDYNASGVRDVANPNEPGVAGVTVTAYNEAGAVVATAVTAADGSYVLSVPDGTSVRVEFTNFPAGYLSGPWGAESVTTVGFLSSPSCSVHLGLGVPSQYCQNNPDLVTNCYVAGNQLTQTLPVLVSFPYSAGGAALPGGAAPPPIDEAESNQIGTTWGLAYQPSSSSLFAAAHMKRHSGFGPNGTGAIYRINRSLPFGSPGRTTLFLDLNTLFPGATGVDPHPAGTNFIIDQNSWDPVGKISLGDIDISEDERTVWAVSLNDRQLYEIPVGLPPVAPPAASIGRFPLDSTGGNLSSLAGLTDCPNPATDIRPFALGVKGGLVYVGMVCSAESTVSPGSPQGDRTQLRAYVYSFNPATNAFAQVLNFRLDYPRTCAVVPGCVAAGAGGTGQADWLPWVTTFSTINTFYSGAADRLFIYPQPWLTDIIFDGADMLLGFRDRYGDQMGYLERSTNLADTALYSGVAAGDILRACANIAGGWTLESNGSCGSRTTAGAGNGQGVGGGEYYYQEDFLPDHDEVSLGGLTGVFGYSDTLQTAYDIFQIYDGGIHWLNNATGQRIKGYEVFALTAPPITFGKAAGLGDIEAMCRAAPLEIGNRVWRDKTSATPNNGLQDAENVAALEFPIANVTVRLYSITGTLLATTTTNARGEYYFNASNVTGGIQPYMTYTIRLDNPANYSVGGPLEGLTVTLLNAGSNDAIDNDGTPCGATCVGVTLTTGGPGANNHTFDFGFVDIPTAVELLYFRTDGVSDRQVSLAWATAAEIDNFGFNLYRGALGDFASAQFVHFEPAALGGRLGATYAFVDTPPSPGTWFYWLVDVDTAGREGAPVVASATLDGGDDAGPPPAPTAVPPVAGPTSAPPAAGPVDGGAASPPGGQAIPVAPSGGQPPASDAGAPAAAGAGDQVAMLPPEPSPQAVEPGQPPSAGVAEAPPGGLPVAEAPAGVQPAAGETRTVSGVPGQATNVDLAIPLVVAGAALGLALVLLRRRARGRPRIT